MKVTNLLRMAALRAQRDGKTTVAQVKGSTKYRFCVRMVDLDDVIAAPLGSDVGSFAVKVWVDRTAYRSPMDGVIAGHRRLLADYGSKTLEQAKEEIEVLASLAPQAQS